MCAFKFALQGREILVVYTKPFCRHLTIELTVRNGNAQQSLCDAIPLLVMTQSYKNDAPSAMGQGPCMPYCPGLQACFAMDIIDLADGLKRFRFKCHCNDQCADLALYVPLEALDDPTQPFDICNIFVQYHDSIF